LPIPTGEVISSDFPMLMAAVAGSPFSEVDVVDSAGEVLFRMPAPLERSVIATTTKVSDRASLGNVMITAEQNAKISPARGDAYLEFEFRDRGISPDKDKIIIAR